MIKSGRAQRETKNGFRECSLARRSSGKRNLGRIETGKRDLRRGVVLKEKGLLAKEKVVKRFKGNERDLYRSKLLSKKLTVT